MSATMTVRRWSFSSSGDTTTHGRAFLISLPSVGSSRTKETWPRPDRLAGYRHFHSSRSNLVAVDSSRSKSSPRARMRLAAAAQPLRGRRAAWTTNRPGCAWSSTSSGRSASSSSVLGIRIPPRIADPHDARLRGHCDYSVATYGESCTRHGGATRCPSR